ncbi:MAG: VOC family protein [Oscillospiraceae bacterium]|jgi:lactoylglutathione lyase|nr:VOC family protein [Oscillospiraceae bacterium]
MFKFAHNNFNVTSLEKSLAFYKDALGLTPVSSKKAADGSFELVFLGDGAGSDHVLELTWLADHPQKYDLGENEIHLAFTTPDMDSAKKLHSKMGVICYENTAMGIYFIEDPDGYWLEIIPER